MECNYETERGGKSVKRHDAVSLSRLPVVQPQCQTERNKHLAIVRQQLPRMMCATPEHAGFPLSNRCAVVYNVRKHLMRILYELYQSLVLVIYKMLFLLHNLGHG